MPELRDPKEVSESPPQPPPSLGGDNTKPFSIREYVLAYRQKDIFQNWPFQVEYLNEFLDHGIRTVLPPFQPLTGRSEKTSEATVSEICSTTRNSRRGQIRLKSSESKGDNKGNDEKPRTPSQNHHQHHHRDHVYLLRKKRLMSESLERVDDDEHNKCESELTDDNDNDDRYLKNCKGTAAINVFTRRKVVLKFDFKGRDSVNSKTRILNSKGSKGVRLE